MLKIIILCGGHGRRLGALSDILPKPLLPLKDKPILQHIIEFYIKKDFRNFVLCTGFGSDMIKEFISNHKFEANIEISNAGEHASMLKRIYEARHFIDEKAIITYGDTYIDIDPHQILERHNKSKALATITVADISSPFGLIKHTDDFTVVSFEEKPVFSYYVGHLILEKQALEHIDQNLLTMPDGEGFVKMLQDLIRKKKLHAFKHSGLGITFNTFKERQLAEEELIKFFTQGGD